jgi:hypothetical protein
MKRPYNKLNIWVWFIAIPLITLVWVWFFFWLFSKIF